jgi:hypothetical protein
MRHLTHDREIMQEVSRRCAVKFRGEEITDSVWNLMYDHVLCDNILETIQWKMKYLDAGATL